MNAPGTKSEPLIDPVLSEGGIVTVNAWPCDWVETSAADDASSAAGPASLGICQSCPVWLIKTILYLPGTRCGCRTGALVGSVASTSAGRAMMVSLVAASVEGAPAASSAGRNGVGSTAAGITCVTVCEGSSGLCAWVRLVESAESSRTRKTRGHTSGS